MDQMCQTASINVKQAEKVLKLQTDKFFKMANFFFLSTPQKKATYQTMTYMPNSVLSYRTTLNKANFLEFSIKMPALQPVMPGYFTKTSK